MPRGRTKNSPSVLVVTHRKALEVDGVIDRLRELGICVSRLNLCEFPEVDTLSIEPDRQTFATVRLAGNYGGAWLHDIGSFSTASSLTGLRRDISVRECTAVLRGLLLSIDSVWLNSPTAIEIASNKIHQLNVVRRLGIPIPPFVVTNDPAMVRAFVREHRRVIVKALGTGYLTYGKRNLKLYTKRLTALTREFLSGLQFGPLLFQREVKKRFEIRVTVVDDVAHSVCFDCQALPARCVDMREIDFARHRGSFSRAADAQKIEAFSRSIVARLGLSYAGLDWVVDEDGRSFFLECNPLGSFKWSEICGQFDISGAIASSLESRARRLPVG